jgi:hypothetical protein
MPAPPRNAKAMTELSEEARSALRARIESELRHDLMNSEDVLRAYRWGSYSGIAPSEGMKAIVEWIGAIQKALLTLADEIASASGPAHP